MTRRRVVLLGVAGLLAVGALVGGFALLKQLAFFEVRRIELVGGRYITAGEIARVLQVPPGASVFDATGVFRERAAQVPGVLEARVTRRIPGTLRVTIREAEPVALTEQGDRLVLLDAQGHALPFDPARAAADLPLAQRDSAVAALLARVRETDAELFARIQRGVRASRDIALELEQGRLLLRSEAGSDDIRDLALVAGLLERQGRSWRELDARFPPRVIVRGSRNGGGEA